MKRNKNLYPLSHQHHNGLMAVLLLEKGVKKNAELKIMNDFIQEVSDIASVDKPAMMEGRTMSVVVTPKKTK